MRRLVLITIAAAGLMAVHAQAGDSRGLYDYERPISGLDPALPCSQLKGYIQHVKLDLSIIRSSAPLGGSGGGPVNTDTSSAHSGDNWSDVHYADGSTSSGSHGNWDGASYAGEYGRASWDDTPEDNARRSLDYLNGLKATCTSDS